jgi:hypothetical protein
MGKLKSKSTIENAILIGLMVVAWSGSNFLLKQIQTLPISALPTPPEIATIIDVKTLYPVLVEMTKKQTTSQVGDDGNIDEVFKAAEEVKIKIPTPPPIDYVALFKNATTLEGISLNGAFINGKFYKKGEVIATNVFFEAGNKIKPVLSSINQKSIGVTIGKKVVTLKMTD